MKTFTRPHKNDMLVPGSYNMTMQYVTHNCASVFSDLFCVEWDVKP